LKVALLWTGGKDSCIAYQKALLQGHEVGCLVTFTGEKPFLCHPLGLMSLQSKALGLPHLKVRIHEPYLSGYRGAINDLMKTHQIKGIVTGDMAVVDQFHGNWLDDVCRGIDIKIVRPLWGVDRYKHLKEIVSSGVKAIFTCVNKTWFDRSWLGRELDESCVEELRDLGERHGIDPCGEGGEYHTMVVDGPMFEERIEIQRFKDGATNSLLYIRVDEFASKPKTGQL